jgi:hypothetical protein
MCCGLTEDENELVHNQIIKNVKSFFVRRPNTTTVFGKFTSEFMLVIIFIGGAGMFL